MLLMNRYPLRKHFFPKSALHLAHFLIISSLHRIITGPTCSTSIIILTIEHHTYIKYQRSLQSLRTLHRHRPIINHLDMSDIVSSPQKVTSISIIPLSSLDYYDSLHNDLVEQ